MYNQSYKLPQNINFLKNKLSFNFIWSEKFP